MIWFTIVFVLWVIIGFTACVQYAPVCAEANLSKQDSLVVFIIFMVGGPFFMITGLLEGILGFYLPEDWNDKDER